MKILGVDYGEKRVGLAVSDPEQTLAFPLKTLYNTSRKQVVRDIVALMREHACEAVALGVPTGSPERFETAPAVFHDDAKPASPPEEPLVVRQIHNVAASLQRRGVTVHLVDETLTSHAAEADLLEVGLTAKRRDALRDQQAAVHILNAFMDRRRNTTSPDPQASN